MHDGMVAEKVEEGFKIANKTFGDLYRKIIVDTLTFLFGETIKDRIERLIIVVCILIILYFGKQLYNKIKNNLTNS